MYAIGVSRSSGSCMRTMPVIATVGTRFTPDPRELPQSKAERESQTDPGSHSIPGLSGAVALPDQTVLSDSKAAALSQFRLRVDSSVSANSETMTPPSASDSASDVGLDRAGSLNRLRPGLRRKMRPAPPSR